MDARNPLYKRQPPHHRKRWACKLDPKLYNCPMIIVDTSVFLAAALDEPEKPAIVRLTTGTGMIGAPEILPYEIGNALSAMYRRQRLTEDEAALTLNIALRMPVRLIAVDVGRALRLATEFGIYAYDAYFLECANSNGGELLTLDKPMKRIASQLGIRVLES
ncbi:tRNA(fMet)-specific endonuclease VapC [Alcanivorax sp. ALC70]|nr:tRNA(fMet)-specific endonuclease VapC [Alcanivorax sp. ALC70]